MNPILNKAEQMRETHPVPVPQSVSARELLDRAQALADRAVDRGDEDAAWQLARLIKEHAGWAV